MSHRDKELELERFGQVHLTDGQVRWLAEQQATNGFNHEDPDEREERIAEAQLSYEIREEALRRHRASKQPALDLPPKGWTLKDALREAPPGIDFTVEGLHVTGANTLLVAKYKTGKTTVAGNLLKALADEEPFLGVFGTRFPKGRVAYLNYELSLAQCLTWLCELGIRHPERVVPFQLRGKRLPFWLPEVRDELATWLKANDVRFLVLDPVGRAWRGLVENENDNANVREFTDAVDELKAAAGIQDAFLPHHTGRKEHEQDAEHGRGATALEDWMDAGWYLTKERDGTRMLRAEGRDVDLAAGALTFDPTTRDLSWTGQSRAQRRHEDDLAKVLAALRDLKQEGDRYPAPLGYWRDAIHGLGKDARSPAIKAAVSGGYVKVEDGPKNSKLHSLTKRGRLYLEKRQEGDR